MAVREPPVFSRRKALPSERPPSLCHPKRANPPILPYNNPKILNHGGHIMADIRVDTIIAGGKIVTSSEVFDAAIAISDEKIVAIGPDHLLPPADRYIDASGKFVLPGLIDCHVHLDRCDSYELGSIAAAHSGLTTLLPFGTYDVEAEEPLPSAINRHREEIESTAVVDFAFHYILNNRPYILKSLPQALEMGVTSFKMFMSYKKNQIRMCTDDFICQVMETVSKGGGIVQLHCESGNIIDYLENQLISQGCVHPTDFPSACPDWAEEEAINRAIKMGNVTNCPVYVVHLSTDVGMERIKQAQGRGPAGLDRDLPPVSPPVRRGNGQGRSPRQDRPTPPAQRRPRPARHVERP